ncbi:MAG: hypothetical protein WC044_05345 [Crocinitomicaceae bacterium]
MRKYILIIIWSLIVAGTLFRLFHWPFSAILNICGTGFLLIFSIGFFILNFRENKISSLFQLCISLWMVRLLFSLLYWKQGYFLVVICLIITVILFFLVLNEHNKFNKKDWFKTAFLISVIWFSSLPSYQTFYFFNFNDVFNRTSKRTNFIAWDKYSWFLNLKFRKDEALFANSMALKSLENFREEYSFSGYNSGEKILLKHRNYIEKNQWNQLDYLSISAIIDEDKKRNARQKESMTIPIQLTEEAKPFIGYWQLISTFQQGVKLIQDKNYLQNEKWKFSKHSFLTITSYEKKMTKRDFPFGRFEVKENIFYHLPLNEFDKEAFKFQFQDSSLFLTSQKIGGKTYHFIKSEEDWDEEVRGPKPK